jgi:hypothetical protein
MIDAGTDLVNTASVTSTEVTLAVTDDATTEIQQSPAFTLTKSATITTDADGDGKADVNDIITYYFSVTNTGNVTLNNIVITDPMYSGTGSPVVCTISLIAPGATNTACNFTYTVTENDVNSGSVVNTATVIARNPSDNIVNETDVIPSDNTTITQTDDVPLANDDTGSTPEDTTLNGSTAGNDTPSSDGGNVWGLVGTDGGAANGTVTMDATGNYTYTPNANYNGTDEFTYQVCDVDTDCSQAIVTITIGPVNDAPVLSDIEATPLAYTENGAATPITATLTVADVDDTNIESAVVSISVNYQNGQDILSFTNANGITGTWTVGTGALSLNGSATLANYQVALRSITYQNTSDNPSTLQRTVSITVNDGSVSSASVTRNIAVTTVNDTPVLSGIEATPLTYTENAAATIITSTLTVADADDVNVESATVSISANYQSGQDVLSFTNANGITGIWTAATGALNLTGSSTLANYQSALQSITYQNTSDNPSTLQRTVSFTVNDGNVSSATLTRNLTVAPGNDAPVLSGIETTLLAYVENGAATAITTTTTVTDADDTNIESAVVSITANYQNGQDILAFTSANGITGAWTAATGVMSLNGSATLASYQAAIRSITYHNTSDNPSTQTRTVSFMVNDGNVYSTVVTRQITVTAVNDVPVAASVTFSGSMIVGSILTGSYIYSDAEGDPEGISTFRWFRADDITGTGEAAIPSATAQTYTLVDADLDKFISFEVTPVASSGNTPGTVVRSIRQPVITLPSNWTVDPADYTYNGVVTATVFIEGTAVESGFLAAFAGEECRGITEATYFEAGGYYIFELTCYSNSTSGDVLTFRYFDPEGGTIYNMDRSVDFASGMNVGTEGAPVKMNNGVNYSISFPVGWSWFSVNTVLDNMTLRFILASVNTNGDYIKSHTASATYYSGFGWFGSLTILDPTKLYIIKVQNARDLEYSGRPVDVNTSQISLAIGWNWIGYLPQSPQLITNALSSLSPVNSDYIKSQTSSSTYYSGFGWFPVITMSPTQGYMLKLTNPGTLKYPNPGKSEAQLSKEMNKFRVKASYFEINGTITGKVMLNGSAAGSENDLLIAYVNDEIRGVVGGHYFDPKDEFLYPLMIHSNLSEGEVIKFRYYDAENDKYYPCKETIVFSRDMIVADALAPFEFNIKTTEKTSDYEAKAELNLRTYPNPFEEYLNIEYDIVSPTNVRLTIYDIYGNPVRELLNQKQEAGHYAIKWNSDLQSTGTYIIKIEAGSLQDIQRTIFMK